MSKTTITVVDGRSLQRWFYQAPDGRTGTVVTSSRGRVLDAREKAHWLLSQGVPFLTYGSSAISVKKVAFDFINPGLPDSGKTIIPSPFRPG